MYFDLEINGEITIIRFPAYDLDAETVVQFNQEIESYLQPSAKLIFDMSRLDFIDSSGLGAILTCKRKLQARNGKLKLCCLTDTVRDIMELVRLIKIFDVYPSREEALRAFASHSEKT